MLPNSKLLPEYFFIKPNSYTENLQIGFNGLLQIGFNGLLQLRTAPQCFRYWSLYGYTLMPEVCRWLTNEN